MASLVLLISCSKSSKAPVADEGAAVEARAPDAVASDDVPRLTLAKYEVVPQDRGTEKVLVNAVLRDADAVYIRGRTNDAFEAGHVRFNVLGDVYGLVNTGDSAPDNFYARFPGKNVPQEFDVAWEAVQSEGVISAKGVLHVLVPKTAKSVKAVREEFFAGLARWFQSAAYTVSGADSFYTFASERARLTSRPAARRNDVFTNDIDDAMAFYTGAASLRDAMQTQRALRIRRTGKRTVPIAQVEALALPAHPWARLSQELGAKASFEPLAAAVPAGMLYMHASSAKALHATVDTLTDRLLGVVQASGIDSGGGDIVKRYADQLGLESSPAMSVLADTAIDGIAIASSDPFFREGTDVTVAFHVTNAALLKTGLAKKLEDLKARFTTSSSSYKLGAHEVGMTASADGAVNRHQLDLGDVILVSNSRAALERFVAVRDSGAPSIAAGGDFAYMRSLYPYDRAGEDAFAFIGDAFVAHVTSPAFKIASARRVQAAADVRAVSYAALLYAWLEGHAPTSVDQLVNSKLLDKNELVHEGGERITFDPATGARSPSTTGFMKPIIETAIDKVTAEERDAYATFRGEYEMVWSKYIDPAALRVSSRGKALTLDVRMLPITNRGDYSDMESLAGPARIAAPAVRDGFSWASAVGPEASLRRELEGTGRSFMGNDFSLGWLGTWVTAGAMDRAGLYDLVVASGSLGEVEKKEDDEQVGFVPPVWRTALQRAPLYVGAEVRNPVALAALLTGARRMVEQAAPGLVEWTTEEPIDGQPVSVIREGGTTPADQRIAIRYATAHGAFMASLSRDALVAQLAALKEGRGPKAAASETKPVPSTKGLDASTQSAFDYAPASGKWLTKIVAGLIERAHTVAQQRDELADRAVAPYVRKNPDANERARITAALLGHSTGRADVSATASVARLRQIGARLSVEGAGDHRGLHAAVTFGE
ncbi:MAG TPA: hypothetical protein VLC93_16740 [Myxococcota bacterium]|nr:hypothetical protein [Myxococcota bacterium]